MASSSLETGSRLLVSSHEENLGLLKTRLDRLVNKHESIQRISKDFDNDTKFISGVADSLKYIGWIRLDKNGTYITTRKGKTNMIVRHSPVHRFNRP